MKKTHKLEKIELVEECGQYYLDVTYLIEDDHKIEKLWIPRIRIPFNANIYPDITGDRNPLFLSLDPIFKINASADSHGDLRIEKLHNTVLFTTETIKEKTHEMTISEIEKKLGYKIKIVSEGKKKC